MNSRSQPRLGPVWWAFFASSILIAALLVFPLSRLARNVFSLAEASREWPTAKANPVWDVVVSSGSSSGFKSGGSISLACRYSYSVQGQNYSGNSFYLGTQRLTLEGGKMPLPFDDFRKKYAKAYDDPVEGYRKENAKLLGKRYENEDGSVSVHYWPEDPSVCTLIPGPGGKGLQKFLWLAALAVLPLITTFVQPLRVLLHQFSASKQIAGG